jgi:hypothetical protein
LIGRADLAKMLGVVDQADAVERLRETTDKAVALRVEVLGEQAQRLRRYHCFHRAADGNALGFWQRKHF